jgi:uncharacterized protein
VSQEDQRIVKCPICKKDVPTDNPNMPFCSDRCRLIDLGNWASEKYVISTPANRNDIEDEYNGSE